jgi:hypothetical protein
MVPLVETMMACLFARSLWAERSFGGNGGFVVANKVLSRMVTACEMILRPVSNGDLCSIERRGAFSCRLYLIIGLSL